MLVRSYKAFSHPFFINSHSLRYIELIQRDIITKTEVKDRIYNNKQNYPQDNNHGPVQHISICYNVPGTEASVFVDVPVEEWVCVSVPDVDQHARLRHMSRYSLTCLYPHFFYSLKHTTTTSRERFQSQYVVIMCTFQNMKSRERKCTD